MAGLRVAASRALAHVIIPAAVLGGVLLRPAPGLAQDSPADPRGAARALGYSGVEAYQAGDYATAEQKLERAFQLLPVPSLGLWSARAQVKTGRLVEGAERYRVAAQLALGSGDPAVQEQAQLEARQERAALLPRIPSLQVQLSGASVHDVRITIDGVPIARAAASAPIALNPGEHWIEGHHQDGTGLSPRSARVRVQLEEGQQQTVRLELGTPATALGLEPSTTPPTAAGRAPADPSDDRSSNVQAWRTGGWVALGVGGGTLIASGVAGLLAWDALDDFDCNVDPCASTDSSAIDRYNALRTFSTLGHVSGGLLAVAGLVLLYEFREPGAGVSLSLGPAAVRLQAAF